MIPFTGSARKIGLLTLVVLAACEDSATSPEWAGWVSTDRAMYESGDVVQLTLSNRSGKEVVLADCGGIPVWVQQRVDGDWEDAAGLFIGGDGGCLGPTPTIIHIDPDSSFSGSFTFEGAGTYRFGYRVQIEPYEAQEYEVWYSSAVRFEEG